MSPAEPFLHVDVPHDVPVRALALVLHGGRARGTTPVHARQLAVLRMAPFATSLRHAGAGYGLAVGRLRYLVRGWNGTQQSPVADVRWALDRVADRFPDLPVALVGHSMGGRAAMYAAGHPAVQAVVGLAPWTEPGDPVQQLAGRHVLVAHGNLDRMTSPVGSRAYAQAATGVAASVSYVEVRGERHPMLRRAGVWHALASGYVVGELLDIRPEGTGQAAVTNVVREALAGRPSLVL